MDAALASRPPARAPGRAQTIVVLAVAAVLISGAAWFIDSQVNASDGFTEIEIVGAARALRVGETPPAFSATTLDGTAFALADHAGKPIWLIFGASWCADCRAEAPDVQAAWERYGPDGLVVLSIALEDADAAKTYAERAGLTIPTVADPRNKIASTFGLFGTPTHYFIDAGGSVQEIRLGGLQPVDMDAILSKLMG